MTAQRGACRLALPPNPARQPKPPAHFRAENAPSMAQKEKYFVKIPTPRPISRARQIARVHRGKSRVSARLAELQASVTKLNSQIAAVAPAEAALADLNTKEDDAALRWATSGEFERPTPDIEARDRLARELAAARASAESGNPRLGGAICGDRPRFYRSRMTSRNMPTRLSLK